MIIDVDSHWEAISYEPREHPLAPWLDELPNGVDMLAFGIAGDLLRGLASEDRPSATELLPALVARAEERGGPVILHPQHESTAAERVEWMDRIGIDHCLVNPGGYWQQLEFIGADRPSGVRRCNDFLTERLVSHRSRLHAVAVVDFTDLGLAVDELQHVRERGARAYFLYTANGRPPNPRSPGHPAWDRVWAATIDLGLVPVIHVGNTATDFTGWADIGWDVPGGAGVEGLVRLANTQRVHAAQNLLAGMLYGGAFARHPALTVLLAEMHIGWIPDFFRTLEAQARRSPILGAWPWEISGGDMLRRSVRVTPLPGFGDTGALDFLAEFPDLCVFSSDYPHQEGNADPIELYRPALDDLDEELRTAFLGENMADCFARMGDPLDRI